MQLLKDFSMLYLCASLPPWWYRVWGSVTTVPLFKTEARETVRPVGVRNPLICTLHSRVIRDNRATLTAVLEPQQLALSQAGDHKLVHQVRRIMEEHIWAGLARNILTADKVCRTPFRKAHMASLRVVLGVLAKEMEEESSTAHPGHTQGFE